MTINEEQWPDLSGFLVDLHCHTRYSYDNFLEPVDLLERARALGLHGVGVLEHNAYRGSEPLEHLEDSFGVQVFRGVEIANEHGHILAFGVRDDGWNRWGRHYHLPLREVVEVPGDLGAICIPAHPFRSHGTDGLADTLFELNGWAAIETFNDLNSPQDDERALEAAKRLGIATVGGSDCHQVQHVGRCLTVFQRAFKNVEELFLDILEGRCRGIPGPGRRR